MKELTSNPTFHPSRTPLSPECERDLTERFGAQFSCAKAVRDLHGRDESPFPLTPPDGVVLVRSTEDVVAAVTLCARHQVPMIPFGVGSSVEGHCLAIQGGVTLDCSEMATILAINADDLTAKVQAGVTREQLNAALNGTGLFFPIDPGANATIGGMTATRASGTNAVRYGTMRENVLALTVVLADGRVVQTGTRAKKSSAGYDLTRLFVGSEGTLGVITEITVKLHPQPEAMSAAVVNFPTNTAAIDTVIQTIQMGVPVARSEYLDAETIQAINAYSGTQMQVAPTLFFEFHGSAAAVQEHVARVQEIAFDQGGRDFQWAQRPEDRTRLWQARHHAYFACLRTQPGCRAVSTDTCVPISRLAESIEGARAIMDQSWLKTMIFGHAGDGNFHGVILVDPENPESLAEAERLNHEIVALALAMDGTCTGEHGIGMHKIDFLEQEAGVTAVDLMRGIKGAFDPLGLLNPGKIFRP